MTVESLILPIITSYFIQVDEECVEEENVPVQSWEEEVTNC